MLTDILVPIFVCVVLPVAIVWIVFYSMGRKNENETRIIIEAIRSNPSVDTEKLIKSFQNSDVSPYKSLYRKLLRGSIFTLIGVAFAFLGAFFPGDDQDLLLLCWWICAICGSIGIGFLVTFWFACKKFHKNEAE